MRILRTLFVAAAVAICSVAFTSPAHAVVAVMVVPCNQPTATTSLTTAPSGQYQATVVGACNWAGERVYNVGPVDVPPCTSGPCATVGVSNIPGETCGTTTGLVRVEATCGAPVAVVTDCMLQVTVDGQCLTVRGTTGQITHGGGAFTARFEDNGHWDNSGYFLVVVRPA